MRGGLMRSLPSMILPIILLSIGLMIVVQSPVNAQTRSVKGTVVDDKNEPVEGAQILIEGIDIVRNYNCKTNKKGEYSYLLGLQSGTFRIVVRKEGFQPNFKENIRPALGEPFVADFQLVRGQDFKLPWEMTAAERGDMLKMHEEQVKRKAMAGEIKETFERGVKLSEAGNYAEAIEEFKKLLEKAPEEPVLYTAIAKAQSSLGNNEESLANYKKAIELDAYNADLYMNMGVVLNTLGKVDESREAFKKSASLDPASAGKKYYNLGATLINSNDTSGAIEAFKQAIVADPGYDESYYQLGICLSGGADTIPAAIEAFKKYVEIGTKPDQVQVARDMIKALEAQ
jgi:tetratricopeptide (TPR) repeat protein